MKFFDLNVPLEDSPSEPMPVKIDYQKHEDSVEQMASFFEATSEDLGGLGWANEQITLITHAGTHVDAPWHYYPTTDGKPARTIDELPLEWFYGDGVVIDMRHKEQGGLISSEDIKAALVKINYTLKPRDIVLIQTDTDKMWGKAEYFMAGAGVSAEATRWLIGQGIKVMGIDTCGLGPTFLGTKRTI